MNTRLENPSTYMPVKSPEIAAHDVPHIEAALPASINEMYEKISRRHTSPVIRHGQKISRTSFTPTRKKPHWHLIIAINLCSLTFL